MAVVLPPRAPAPPLLLLLLMKLLCRMPVGDRDDRWVAVPPLLVWLGEELEAVAWFVPDCGERYMEEPATEA